MNIELKKRDRICFLGDSITANGRWIAEVFEYFVKTYPELKIGFYNCGIAGSRGYEANLKDRIYCDCFQLFPRYVVVMFGMNDVSIVHYNSQHEDYDKPEIRKRLLTLYEEGLDNIISLCQKEDIVPIICSPTPYDQYTTSDTPNLYADEGLIICEQIAKRAAEKHNLLYINMRKALIDRIDEQPVELDRIHPNEYGHHLMSECFLTAIGAKEKEEHEAMVDLSDENNRRWELERKIRNIMFVERDGYDMQFQPSVTIEERKRIANAETEQPDYYKNSDYRDEIWGELIKATSQMYHT